MRVWHVLVVCAVGLAGLVVWICWPSPPATPSGQSAVEEQESEPAAFHGAIPQVAEGEYISSNACAECHAQAHATWHASFHRQMTQVVSAGTVLAPMDNIALESRGRSVRFFQEGSKFFVDMVDPDWDAAVRDGAIPEADQSAPPRVTKELVMSTGAHHYQTYWVNSSRGNELRQVPWVYHLAEQRWLPAEDAFVRPPNEERRLTVWNNVCIQCHAVRGQPGLNRDTGHFTSQVVELGIACESCHGPARRHVEWHRAHDSRTTEKEVATAVDSGPITNPAKLTAERSAQVCGQCHSYFSFSDPSFWVSGFTYRPGEDLLATRIIHDFRQEHVQSQAHLVAGYWGDGTMRIAGREYSAMDDSACFKSGKLSCISCHSMHGYEEADDQLAPEMRGRNACLQCHAAFRTDVSAHTHHSPESVGSDCYNCHMPHTSYGLLQATRSHRIDSPTASMSADGGKPNACNLCHQDKPLQWTSQFLSSWYGQESVTLAEDDQQVALSLRMLLRGDAVQRSVVAWNYGWRPAQQASPGTWQVPFLALLLIDPYAAVRSTAYGSLRTYPGFADFQYDFLAAPEQRAAAMRAVITKWRSSLPPDASWDPESVLLDTAGGMRIESVRPLVESRDDRPLELPE